MPENGFTPTCKAGQINPPGDQMPEEQNQPEFSDEAVEWLQMRMAQMAEHRRTSVSVPVENFVDLLNGAFASKIP